MGKRTPGRFERSKHDLYDTPDEGVPPLIPFLPPATRFIEPCFGNGHLAELLQAHGHVCVGAYDYYPRKPHVLAADARRRVYDISHVDAFITNPPWTRRFKPEGQYEWEYVLHPLIENLSKQLPTWLLLDSDWAYNAASADLMLTCTDIVAIGRLKWIPGTLHQGVDNCSWYRFTASHSAGPRLHNLRGKSVEKSVGEKRGGSFPRCSEIDPQEMHLSNRRRLQSIEDELSP